MDSYQKITLLPGIMLPLVIIRAASAAAAIFTVTICIHHNHLKDKRCHLWTGKFVLLAILELKLLAKILIL